MDEGAAVGGAEEVSAEAGGGVAVDGDAGRVGDGVAVPGGALGEAFDGLVRGALDAFGAQDTLQIGEQAAGLGEGAPVDGAAFDGVLLSGSPAVRILQGSFRC